MVVHDGIKCTKMVLAFIEMRISVHTYMVVHWVWDGFKVLQITPNIENMISGDNITRVCLWQATDTHAEGALVQVQALETKKYLYTCQLC